MTLIHGVMQDNKFITYNIIQVLGIQALQLIIYSSLIHFWCFQHSPSSSEDILPDDLEEVISESTPLFGNQNQANQDLSLNRKAAYMFGLYIPGAYFVK